MSETTSPREVDMNIVEVTLVGQTSPNLTFFRLGINNLLMCAPLGIILQERFFEINLKIKVIVIGHTNAFELCVRSVVLGLYRCLDEHGLHLALFREVGHDRFLEISHLILDLLVDFHAACVVLLGDQNQMSLRLLIKWMERREF